MGVETYGYDYRRIDPAEIDIQSAPIPNTNSSEEFICGSATSSSASSVAVYTVPTNSILYVSTITLSAWNQSTANPYIVDVYDNNRNNFARLLIPPTVVGQPWTHDNMSVSFPVPVPIRSILYVWGAGVNQWGFSFTGILVRN